jgi:hypothetical protein
LLQGHEDQALLEMKGHFGCFVAETEGWSGQTRELRGELCNLAFALHRLLFERPNPCVRLSADRPSHLVQTTQLQAMRTNQSNDLSPPFHLKCLHSPGSKPPLKTDCQLESDLPAPNVASRSDRFRG